MRNEKKKNSENNGKKKKKNLECKEQGQALAAEPATQPKKAGAHRLPAQSHVWFVCPDLKHFLRLKFMHQKLFVVCGYFGIKRIFAQVKVKKVFDVNASTLAFYAE